MRQKQSLCVNNLRKEMQKQSLQIHSSRELSRI